MRKRDLLSVLSDPRCPMDAEVKIRIVDRRYSDGVHGSFRSIELPIDGGFTGWEDGHWSVLVPGPVAEEDKE